MNRDLKRKHFTFDCGASYIIKTKATCTSANSVLFSEPSNVEGHDNFLSLKEKKSENTVFDPSNQTTSFPHLASSHETICKKIQDWCLIHNLHKQINAVVRSSFNQVRIISKKRH